MAQRGMTPFSVSLVANQAQALDVEGNYVHFLTVPLPSGIEVRFDESKQATYYEGVGLQTSYSRVELLSTADQDIVVLLGFGSVFDARATANVSVASTIAPANALTNVPEVTVPAGTSAKLADANDDRQALRLSIKSSETGAGVYFGNASIAAATGGWLEPGMIDYPDISAECWAFNPGGVDIIVQVLELKRV